MPRLTSDDIVNTYKYAEDWALDASARERDGAEDVGTLLTADEVLQEVDTYCAAGGNPQVAKAMRYVWERDGKMPNAVLTSLKLKPVARWERVAPKVSPPKPEDGDDG